MAASNASTNTGMNATERELALTRVLDAPRELVFKVWTDPKHFVQWWGPHKFTNPVCELDARPGGAILIHMRGPDGTVHRMTGVYVEVVRPERLVFTSSALDQNGKALFEQRTTVTFDEQNGKTKLTVHSRVYKAIPAAAPALQGMEMGWTQTLERLASHLAVESKDQSV